MYKIANQNIEFASRWRRELAPREVAYGKLFQREYAVSKSKGHNSRLEADVNEIRKDARRTREKYKINKNPLDNPNLNTRIYKSNKTSISGVGKEKLRQLKSAYNKRKIKTNIVTAKRFLSNNKLKLGAVGLATAGVIGYGLYRKMRSDKGRKRGRYK